MSDAIKVEADLTSVEAGRLTRDIGALEDIGRYFKIEIDFRRGKKYGVETKCHVTLTIETEDFGDDLVRASFRNGMMRHWGWSEKFKLPDPIITPPSPS